MIRRGRGVNEEAGEERSRRTRRHVRRVDKAREGAKRACGGARGGSLPPSSSPSLSSTWPPCPLKWKKSSSPAVAPCARDARRGHVARAGGEGYTTRSCQSPTCLAKVPAECGSVMLLVCAVRSGARWSVGLGLNLCHRLNLRLQRRPGMICLPALPCPCPASERYNGRTHVRTHPRYVQAAVLRQPPERRQDVGLRRPCQCGNEDHGRRPTQRS